ncbi:hypothetical protein B0O99DRAFT_626159 [Bisporella sp. PMI_857]|nr:hypothetical protein B0O99DRAFT_626159 [Bisporella sp. PMI_857]
MGAFFETIPESLIPWILAQHIIYIASAPLSGDGHVNVSPKGGAYFGVVDNKTFWYQDLTGSGSETISHLHEPGNGRITVLLNAFEGAPRILRLWGHGRPLEYGTKEFWDFREKHNVKTIPGTRAIVVVDIHQVGTSCGFSVPIYDFKEYRTRLNEFAEKRVAAQEAGNWKDGMDMYWAHKNQESMDGLPSMKRAVEVAKKEKMAPIKKMVGAAALKVPMKTQNKLASVSPVLLVLGSFFAGVVVATFLIVFARGLPAHDILSDDLRALAKGL